jgi:hypothetical protein
MLTDCQTSRSVTNTPAGRYRLRGGGLRQTAVANSPFLRRRNAFTIFELLLALTLLLTALAVSWPFLDRLQLEHRLQQGAQLVQARVAGARVHAIDAGLDYEFRYEPGGQRFLVLPHDQQALLHPPDPAAGARPLPKTAGWLPSPQTAFDPSSTGGTVPQPVPSEWLAGIPDAEQFAGVNWSAPLVFHADGTATTGRLVIHDRKSRFVIVSIRALTGGVSVSKVAQGGTQ